MNNSFDLKATVVLSLKKKARTGIFDGTELTAKYIKYCSTTHLLSGTNLVYTRDARASREGIFKNPADDRALHLSLSFFNPETKEPDKKNAELTDEWLALFFGDNKKVIWAEPPTSQRGKQLDVWHYRLFVYSDWSTPLLPSGEVYARKDLPIDWKSWHELFVEVWEKPN